MARRESGVEEDWNMDCEEEVENKKKLDEQRKKAAEATARSRKIHVYDAGHSKQAQRNVAAGATGH